MDRLELLEYSYNAERSQHVPHLDSISAEAQTASVIRFS